MTDLDKEAAAGTDDWAAALAEQGGNGVSRAPLENFQAQGGEGGQRQADLEQILDIPVTLSVEIGKSRLCIRNLLQLN